MNWCTRPTCSPPSCWPAAEPCPPDRQVHGMAPQRANCPSHRTVLQYLLAASLNCELGQVARSIRGVVMIGALLLGLFCGIVARLLVPGDVFRKMNGPVSWL